jgi:hypothetical protein
VPAGFVLLLALACLLYVLLIGAIYGSPEGDPAMSSGESRYSLAWTGIFEMIFGVPLWLAVGGLLLSAARSGRMPVWARGWSLILYAAAGITIWCVSQVYIASDGGVSVIVSALLVPLIAGYAAAMRLPALERLPPDRASGVALVAGGILVVAAIPLGFLDLHNLPAHVAADARHMDAVFAQRQAEVDKLELEEEARFKTLRPDSSLQDYVRFVHYKDEGDPERAAALVGARLVKSRQADAAQMLDQGKLDELWELWQYNLEPTPDLCAAYDRALLKLATNSEMFDLNVAQSLQYQLPNIKFFAGGHCNLDASLTAAEARLNKVIAVPGNNEWKDFLATLVALHQQA